MKFKKAPLIFLICLSFTMLSCDNGESDHAMGNLSEFAKEFVSTHMGSPNSMNMGNEAPFNQLVQNLLNVLIMITGVWFINQMIQRAERKMMNKSAFLRQHDLF